MNDKAAQLVLLAEKEIGSAYVFGAWGGACSPSYRKKYAACTKSAKDAIYKTCPVLSGASEKCDNCKYQNRRAFDCRGFTAWALKTAGIIDLYGEGATTQYNKKENWDARGTMDAMPELPCVLFRQSSGKMAHTGLYVGEGCVIHASSPEKGVIKSELSASAWTHFALPKGLYTENEIKEAGGMTQTPELQQGARGDAVTRLQEKLNALGYPCGAADGKFGEKTKSALMRFQTDAALSADGICGEETWRALDQKPVTRAEFDALSLRVFALEEKKNVG